MSVATLAGTMWKFNEQLNLTNSGTVFKISNVSFVSNCDPSKIFTGIQANRSVRDGVDIRQLRYVYNATLSAMSGYEQTDTVGEWSDIGGQIICFRDIAASGHTNASNITWMENNAVQIDPCNKVVIGTTTYVDLSKDTITSENLLSGYTAHDANGLLIGGTYSGGGGIDPSDATATADDILSSKTAYIADGSKATGTIATITTPSNTVSIGNIPSRYTVYQDRFHAESSDQYILLDKGYHSADEALGIDAITTTNLTAENIKNGVTITVGDSADADRIASVTGTYTGGGSISVVHGEFKTQSTAGVQSVTVPYTGSGYPIMCYVVIKGGAYVSGTTWYNSTQRYAIGVWACSKSVMSSAPTYGTSGAQNQAVTMSIYKNSTSSSTSYTRTSAMNTNTFSSSNATNAAATAVRFKGNAKTLSVYVNTSSYGLFPSQDYEYWIAYSS